MADPRRPRRRAAALLLTMSVALALTAAVAHLAAASSLGIPRLGLSWSVVERRCWTASTRVQVRRHKWLRIEKRTIRRCGDRPVRVHGRVLHLAWRQHGELFGRLTLSGKPIAGAPLTIAWTIPTLQSGTETVITGRKGRFSAYMPGPSKIVTASYQYAPGAVIATSRRLAARAWLSLHVGQLIGGRRARFHGALAGHYIPRDLYIQFWYWAGASGWQPFSHLAIVNPQTGRRPLGHPDRNPARHRRLHVHRPRHRRALSRLAVGAHQQRHRRPLRLLTEPRRAAGGSSASSWPARAQATSTPPRRSPPPSPLTARAKAMTSR